MIRPIHINDVEQLADIWFNANRLAHDFISPQYWQDNLDLLKDQLLSAEVYVYEVNHRCLAFIGLNGDYIEGIFVLPNAQSKGIGTQLIDFVKTKKNKLWLYVYQKNKRAIAFYQHVGFEILSEGMDQATGEADYQMAWHE